MNRQVMTKKIRYSIRKSKRYKGAISVGIGCLFLLGYLVLGSSIQADETESIHSVEYTETLNETSADLATDSTVDSIESVNDDKVDANTDALSTTDVGEIPKEQPIQPMEETSESVASSTDDSNSNQPETKEGTILTSDYQPEKVITIDEPADYPALPLRNAYHPDKYFIFKSVIDNWSGEVYYFAVNRQQDDGVLFIFDQNGNLRQTQLAGSKKQLDNTVVINYGDTYTINHPYNALSYDYSGDGEKSSVEKNAVYNAITGILPKQSIVTVRYVDENQTDIVAPVQKRALSGESRDIQGPISIEGYVYQYTTGNTKGSVSIYSSEKINQTWSRHFTYSATNSEIRADYTLLDNQGKFRVDIYRNDLLQKSTTLKPGQYTDYAVYTNGAVDRYRFPNPFIPDSGEVIFHYARVGKIVPVDESNQPIPAAPTPSYHTNPDDPENVLPDEPTPDILGYTKTINTITPVNPTEDTPVVYIRNKEVGTLSVRYIDQDNQNQEITGTGKTISGTYGDKIVYSTQPTIESLVKKGYELVHDGFTEGGKELGKDNTGKVYEVIFKHGTQTYTPEHPGVPGTPINPEDPTGSQTPQGTTYQDLVKQASQTIHYTGAGEQTPKDHVTINEKAFTRSVTVDKVTGEIIARSAWQPATVTFETVISPVVSGYQVDKPKAGGLEATVEQPDVVDEVVYVQEGTLSVRYIDQDNQNQEIAGTGETISGTYGDKIVYSTQPTIESLVKKGYELVHDGFTEGGKELGKDNTGKVYEVIFKHGTQTYTPEHPGVPGTPINPEDPTGSQTPQGTTYQDLVKQASQTIHYTGAGEQIPKDHVIINEKAFTRSVTVDKVTGEIIARSAWQPATVTFETVISPVVSGYQVDKPKAGGLEATVEQPDVVDEVNYALKVVVVPTIQKGSVDVSYLDEKGQLLPGTVVEIIKNQVPVGETYAVEVKTFTGYTFLKLAEDSAALQGKVENTVKHVRLVYQKVLTPVEEPKPQLPNTGGNPQPTEPINEPVTKINKAIPVTQPVTVQPMQSTEEKARMTSRQLPKTGMEGINAAWGFICLALAGLFYKKAKRKND